MRLRCLFVVGILMGVVRLAGAAPGLEVREAALGKVGDGELSGWEGTEKGKVEISREHVADGKAGMKATLAAGPYPGIAFGMGEGMDWSGYEAVRFSLFNPGKDFKLSFRVDEAGSTNFATRYQSDLPLKVGKGANELEISLAALRQGNLFSRGIDVKRVKSLRLFVGGVKEEMTFFVSNVRLVQKKGGAQTVRLDEAVDGKNFGITAKGLTKVTWELHPKRAFVLDLREKNYPGFELSNIRADWLGYDLLGVDLSAVEGAGMPENVSIKIADRNGRRMTFTTSLLENKGHVLLPLEMVGQLSLGQVSELTFFFSEGTGKSVRLENLRLDRLAREDFPNVHAGAAKEAGLVLDFSPVKAMGKASVFMGMVLVPLEDGTVRMVRCNSEVQGNFRYEVPMEAMKGCKVGGEVRVWGYLTEHGIWHFRQTGVKWEGKGGQVVLFGEAKGFNH
jgi:hypothetical protein